MLKVVKEITWGHHDFTIDVKVEGVIFFKVLFAYLFAIE